MNKLRLRLLIPLMIALCGCGNTEYRQQPPEEVEREGEPMEITSFSFTHTGMSTEECFLYSIRQTDDGIRLYTEELFSGGFILDMVIDEPVLEKLGEIAGKYRLDAWDGFDKNNRHVMDGSNFTLSITLADEKTISARGSNSFPEGYRDAEQEICALFEELIEKYGNRHPKTLESDEAGLYRRGGNLRNGKPLSGKL